MPEGIGYAVEAEKKRRNRTEEALAALGEGRNSRPKKKAPKKTEPAHSEARGVGEPAYESVEEARIALLRGKLAQVKDPVVQQKLRDQIKALQNKE